jgi:hypothetical protein
VIPAVTKHRVSGPAFVQSAGNSGLGGQTITLSGVTAGNAIIAIYQGTVDTGVTLSDSNGTLTQGINNLSGTCKTYTAYLFNAASGTHTITTSGTGTHYWTMFAVEVSGLTSFDTSQKTTASSVTTVSTPSLTPTATDFVFAAVSTYANTTAFTNPPTGFTSMTGGTQYNTACGEGCWAITSSAISATWNWTGTGTDVAATALAFK